MCDNTPLRKPCRAGGAHKVALPLGVHCWSSSKLVNASRIQPGSRGKPYTAGESHIPPGAAKGRQGPPETSPTGCLWLPLGCLGLPLAASGCSGCSGCSRCRARSLAVSGCLWLSLAFSGVLRLAPAFPRLSPAFPGVPRRSPAFPGVPSHWGAVHCNALCCVVLCCDALVLVDHVCICMVPLCNHGDVGGVVPPPR